MQHRHSFQRKKKLGEEGMQLLAEREVIRILIAGLAVGDFWAANGFCGRMLRKCGQEREK